MAGGEELLDGKAQMRVTFSLTQTVGRFATSLQRWGPRAYERIVDGIREDQARTDHYLSASSSKTISLGPTAKNYAAPRVLISYSHKDEIWRERLETHLRSLTHDTPLEIWDDTQIRAGDNWQEQLEGVLQTARIAVLIISADYLGSDFIRNNELPLLLERNRQLGVKIVPILAKFCDWKGVPWLSELQMCPAKGEALENEPTEINRKLATIAREIRHYVEAGCDAPQPATT